MIAGMLTVNAFSAYEPIERRNTYYEYAGEFGLGRQTVKEVEWNDEISDYYVYYSFVAEHDGYYSFAYGEMHQSTYFSVCSKQNYDAEMPYTYCRDYFGQWSSKIYYLEAGEYFCFADVYESLIDVAIFAEYLGEKVSEIKFNHDLLLDCDCFYDSNDYSVTNFKIDANATIVFDSGKTLDFGNIEIYEGHNRSDSLNAVIASEPIEGENFVTIFFFNQQIETTVTIHTLSYYVNDVDVSNIDYYLENAVEYYNYYDIEYPYGETVTVTFNNGTSDSFVFSTFGYENFVTFPNGQKYSVDLWHFGTYDFADFNGYMRVYICYNTMKEFQINGSKASFSENIRALNESNKYFFEKILYYWERAKSSRNNTEELSLYLSYATSYFIDISNNMSDFLEYYLTFNFLK